MTTSLVDAIERTPDYTPPGPTPLVRQTPPSPPYPVSALGPLREAAEAIIDMVQVPAAMAAHSVMGVAGLATQHLADVQLQVGRAPLSLFLLTVAQSGERKTTSDNLAMRPVRDFEAELAEQRKTELVAYRNAHDIWTEKRKKILKELGKSRGADRDDLEAELDALGAEPEPPLSHSIVAGDPTYEGVTRHLGILRPSIGIMSNEAGAFLGGHAMSPENRMKTAAGLSGFWDGAPIDRWRAGDGVSSSPGRRFSAHMMVQPIVADDLLTDPIANGQGLLSRFLIACPPSNIGTRTRLGHSEASERALESFAKRIGDLLRRPLPLKDGTRNELAPALLAPTHEARLLLQTFSRDIELAQANGGPCEDIRPFASKAGEHAARLAGVLTLYADPLAREIDPETMSNAINLVGYYLAETRRLTQQAEISGQVCEAERLRKWLFDVWDDDFISAADATQRGPFRETERNRRAIKYLCDFDCLIPVEGGANIKGSTRREVWRINREHG